MPMAGGMGPSDVLRLSLVARSLSNGYVGPE